MDKALLNFLAIICFIGTIMYVLPMNDIDVGATISHLTLQSISDLQPGLPSLGPVSTPRPVPTIIDITPWPPSRSTPTPTALPSPTPAVTPSPTPSPSPVPTVVPGPTATTPGVLPTVTVTIMPSPVVTGINTPGPGNEIEGPVTGNVTAAPTAAAGNVTEKVGGSNTFAISAIVILALLLIGLVVWSLWKGKK